MGIIPGSRGRGPGNATFTYDRAVQGGSTGAKTLTAENGKIPDNAVITNVYVENVTTATSGGAATIKLGFTGNDDAFLTPIAYNNGEFTAEEATVADTELPLKTTAAVDVIMTIAGAALTAGKFRVHVDYAKGV